MTILSMTMNQPFFSIIIPALNEEKYLPKLLADLEKQTYKDFEVIIVDGNSEDETVAESQKFKSKFKKLTILSTDQRNVSFSRNLGAKNAKGEWFLFFDADDRLPDFYLDGLRYRIHHKKVDLFTTYCEVTSKVAADNLIAQYINTSIEVSIFMERPMAWGSMIGISQKGFKKVGGFDEKTKMFEDKKFVGEAYEKGLVFDIFKDPKYIFSIRRFKSQGRVKAIQKYMELTMKSLTNTPIDQEKEYKMGGDAFEKKGKKNIVDKFLGMFGK
jgi:glycosyltransferase involved in cell wall biosynthesis